MKRAITGGAVGLCAAAFAASALAASTTVTTPVTPKNNGKTVSIKVSNRVEIVLKNNNPSTGYHWTYITKPSKKVLALVSDKTPTPKHKQGTVGFPEPRYITYRGVAKGTTKVKLVYLPPGSGKKKLAGTLSVTIRVN